VAGECRDKIGIRGITGYTPLRPGISALGNKIVMFKTVSVFGVALSVFLIPSPIISPMFEEAYAVQEFCINKGGGLYKYPILC
jgi:hypothetical protein